jgi:hypothetical protein
MARIRVYRSEADGADFPRMCMRCGEEAECDVPQRFTWTPSWVPICILLGLLPWLIIMLATRKTMRVVVPMCARHSWHWLSRKLYVWLGLLFWATIGICLLIIGDLIPSNLDGPIACAYFGGGFVWLISALIVTNGAIKAREIRERSMDLVNVDRDFADIWNDMVE